MKGAGGEGGDRGESMACSTSDVCLAAAANY